MINVVLRSVVEFEFVDYKVMYGMFVFEEEDVAFVGWQLALGHGAFC